MVATSNRLNRQPQRYDRPYACLLGPFAGFVPSVNCNDPKLING
jgi:hypothetical protein